MSTEYQLWLDDLNARYWNEPCGTHLARNTNTENNYRAFDAEYFKRYPFLKHYLDMFSGSVLEIGTGYGTVATYLAKRCDYLGFDIAIGPCAILGQRGLKWQRGNVLNLPYKKEKFDGVVSIGCLHHTGNIPKALSEIWRVLKRGGRTLIMLYNEDADVLPVDKNSKGERAPHIEYTSVNDIPELFRYFRSHEYHVENGSNKDIYIEAIK